MSVKPVAVVAGTCDAGAGATLGAGIGMDAAAGTTEDMLGAMAVRGADMLLLLVGIGVAVPMEGAAPLDAGGKGVIGCEPKGAGGTTEVGRVGVGPDGLDTKPPEMESG